MLQRVGENDRYLAGHADSRFFPPKTPWGQRVGAKLGIHYRGLTNFFMGDHKSQAEAILQSTGKITQAVERAIDAALIPPQPHRYRIGLSLRWGVRHIARPVALTLGLIPGVEALVWDVPRAGVNAAQGRLREAFMTLTIATLDFAPAIVAVITGIATIGTGVAPVIGAGVVIGWLTQWRYFHPYIREHYSDRDEQVMQWMLRSLTDEAFVRSRSQTPVNLWERAFPRQARYALAIAKHGDRHNVAGAIKQNILKATHARLADLVPQLQQQYAENRVILDTLLASTQGQIPSRRQFMKRRRYFNAYADMLDAYEALEQFQRVNTMHRLLFNAYAVRNAIRPTQMREDLNWLESRRADGKKKKR